MVEKNSGSEGAATEVSMKLTAPFVGETLEISVDPGANIALIGVESSDLSFSQSAESSTDLIIDVTGGGQIILEGFFFAADTALPAALTLDDGTVISTDQILADAGDVELGDLAPAAGGAAHGGGAGFGEAPDESIVDGLNQVGLLGNDEFPGGIEQPTEELLQDPTSPPVAVDDTNTVSEDEVLTASGNVLDNDSDADGDELTPTLLSDTTGEHGLLEFNADGSYIYTLDNESADVQALGVGQTLTDTFTYQIDDGTGGMDTATLTITITGSNDTPEVTPDNPAVAQPDEGVVQEDVTLSVSDNALDNDDDPDGDTLTATLDGDGVGTFGTLNFESNGDFTYTLNNDDPVVQALAEGESHTETFTYTADDGNGGTATSTITITVRGTNDAPVATADVGDVQEDVKLEHTGNVLANDSDVDNGAALNAALNGDGAGSYGSINIDANGDFTYTLDNDSDAVQDLEQGATVTDTFTYTVTDEHGATDTETVTITITGTNDGPLAADDTGDVQEDVKLVETGNVLGNDIGFGAGGVTPLDEDGTFGSVAVGADGEFTYTLSNGTDGTPSTVQNLAEGEVVTDSFTYTITDEFGETDTATLTITVTGTNDGPVAQADAGTVTEDVKLAETGNVLANDSDIDNGATLSATQHGDGVGTYGTITIGADGAYTYNLDNAADNVQALAEGETVTDTFTYTVTDEHGATATADVTITITGTNDVPLAQGDEGSVVEDVDLEHTGNLLGNDLADDSDPDNDADLTTTLNGDGIGTFGSIVVSPDGEFTYSLNNGTDGVASPVQNLAEGEAVTDSFTYTLMDEFGATDTATIVITVTGTNDEPIATDNVNDVIAPDLDDPNPVATTAEGNVITDNDGFGVDSDIDNSAVLTVANNGTLDGEHGELALNEDGSYTYTVDINDTEVGDLGQGDTVTDMFTYTLTDEHGATDTATLTVTIFGTNEAPTATANTAAVVEDGPVSDSGNVLTDNDGDGVDTDPDGDPLTIGEVNGQIGNVGVAVVGTYGSVTINSDGSYDYALANGTDGVSSIVQDLAEGETVTDTFTYQADDGFGGKDTASLTITITGTNDEPVATGDVGTVQEDVDLEHTGNVLANDSDIDNGATLTAALNGSGDGTYGSISIDGNGFYTYSLANGVDGESSAVQDLAEGQTVTDSFTYTTTDENGATDTAEVTITITGTNDAPVANDDTGSVTEDSDTIENGNVLSNDSDIDNGAVLDATLSGDGVGTYGSITIDPDGDYTYTLANDSDLVQQLDPGETVTDTFTYTTTDEHGATDTAQVTITINGADDGATLGTLENETVDESVLPDGTGVNAGSLVATGEFTFSTVDGFGALSVGGTPIATLGAIEGTSVNTEHGTIVLDTLTDNGSGSYTVDYTYTLSSAEDHQNEDGFDNIAIVVTDEDGSTTSDTLAVTILDDEPDAVNEAGETTIEGAAAFGGNVLTNDDSGADGFGSVAWTGVAGGVVTGDHGSLSVDAAGNWTYTPNNSVDSGETDTFTYTLTDGDGDTDTATLTISFEGDANTPTIVADTGNVDEDDLNPDGSDRSDPITDTGTVSLTVGGDAPALFEVFDFGVGDYVSITSDGTSVDGQYGTLVVDTDGSWTYTLDGATTDHGPANDGQDSVLDDFDVRLTDSDGSTSTDTLSITVVDDVPTANADGTVAVAEDTATVINVTNNDTFGADGVNLVTGVALLADASNGSAVYNDNGTFTYTPDAGFEGTDSFTYTITDGDGDTSTATVTVNVATDSEPELNSGNASVDETGGFDTDTGTLTVDFGNDTGNLALAATDATWNGSDTLSADDGTWTITVNNDGTYTFEQLAVIDHPNDANPNDSIGIDVTATATDNEGDTATSQFTVTVFDDGPVASPDGPAAVAEDTATIINVTDNDTPGADGVDLATGVALLADASNGSAVYNDDGTFTYTPDAGFEGTDSFTYTLTDGDGDTSTATVSVNVAADSVPSVIASGGEVDESALLNGSGGGTLTDTGTLTISHTGTDTTSKVEIQDKDGNWIDVTAGGNVTGDLGSLSVDASGNWTYTLGSNSTDHADTDPNDGDSDRGDADQVQDNFAVRVTDSDGDVSSQDTLSIDVNDDGPTANADGVVSVVEDTATQINVIANDTRGADGVSLTTGVALLAGASNGSVSYNNDGTFTYTPNAGFEGADSFTYTITDGDGDISTATVSVNVGGDSVPNVSAGNAQVDETGGLDSTTGSITATFGNDGPGSVALSATGASWDGTDTLSSNDGAWEIVVNGDGTYTFTQLAAFDHTDAGDPNDAEDFTITATATDSEGDTSTTSFTVTILDDGPVFTGADNVFMANEEGSFAVGDVVFDFGEDGAGEIRFSASNGDQLFADDNSAVLFNSAPIYLYIDPNDSGRVVGSTVQGGDAATVFGDSSSWIFEATLDSGAGTYQITLFEDIDAGFVSSPVGDAVREATGPTDWVILQTAAEEDLLVMSGFTVDNQADMDLWFGGDQSVLNVEQINGSLAGWGVNNNNFNPLEIFRLEFGDGTPGGGESGANPAFDGPVANGVTLDFTSNFSNGDQFSVVVRYDDGDGNIDASFQTFTIGTAVDSDIFSFDGSILSINAGANLLDTVEVGDISGSGKFTVTGVTRSLETGSVDFDLGVEVVDGDGDVTPGEIDVQVTGGDVGTEFTGTALDDVLVGGQGDDTLTGAGGDDSYYYNGTHPGSLGGNDLTLAEDNDTITDFNAGDSVNLDAIFDALGVADNDATRRGMLDSGVDGDGNAVLTIDDGDADTDESGFSVTFEGVTEGELDTLIGNAAQIVVDES